MTNHEKNKLEKGAGLVSWRRERGLNGRRGRIWQRGWLLKYWKGAGLYGGRVPCQGLTGLTQASNWANARAALSQMRYLASHTVSLESPKIYNFAHSVRLEANQGTPMCKDLCGFGLGQLCQPSSFEIDARILAWELPSILHSDLRCKTPPLRLCI
ncbi:hypothetical protein BGX38DRAFT_531837 [Terfezia claveryi]|nr:hypothetical protein BGX38DRAFT_531837 [Terfezia claveryi]